MTNKTVRCSQADLHADFSLWGRTWLPDQALRALCPQCPGQPSGFEAELLNGRTAMIGFVVGVLTEALTGHGIVSQISFGIFGCN